MDSWFAVVAAVSQLVQSAALLAAGLWAYFRFVRSGASAQRVSLSLAAELLPGTTIVKATVTLHNAGQRRVWLHRDRKERNVSLFGPVDAAVAGSAGHSWRETPVVTQPVFLDDYRIEPSETIEAEVLLTAPPMPHAAVSAILVRARVLGRGPFWLGRDLFWEATRIVTTGPTVHGEKFPTATADGTIPTQGVTRGQ